MPSPCLWDFATNDGKYAINKNPAITVFSYGLESARYSFGKLLEEKNRMLIREKEQLDKALKEIKTLSEQGPILGS